MYGGRGQDRGGDPEEIFKKLFIGGLSFETTDDGLRQHFEQFGEIKDCVVIKDTETKRPKGFGFVTYATREGATNAQKNRPHKLDNRQVDTKRAMPKDRAELLSGNPVQKMFVGGLSEDTTEENLREAFQEYGDITSVELIKDKNTGKLKKFCFLSFEDTDSVDVCVLTGRFEVNGKTVEVKKSLPKGEFEAGGGRGGRGGRGGSRGGGRGGYSQGGGYQGGGFGGQGGYSDYSQSGYGAGYQQQSYGGGGGGGYDSYTGGYQQQSFGQDYGSSYGGGSMGRSSGGNRPGPYSGGGGGGYGRGSGGYSRR